MSDENSFGTVATKTPTAPVAAESEAGRSSRAFFIAAGVAVVVLAVFGYILFGSSGAPEEAGAVPKPVQPAGAPTQPTEDAADKPATAPAKATDSKGRNPFVPLEVPAAAEDSTGTDTTGTDTSDGGSQTDPTTTPTTPTQPGAETVTVTLVSVKGDHVATKVGKVNYTGLAAGDTFGTNFQVYAIFNESCAGLLYGDQSFALCEGGSTTLTKS